MAKKLTRKDMKVTEDEFFSTMSQLFDFVHRNRNTIIQAVVIVAVMVIVIFAYTAYRRDMNQNAILQQTRGVMFYNEAIAMLSENPQNKEESEEDRAKARETKFRDAITEFEKVTSDYQGYSVAPEALYYTANCYYNLKDFTKAKELYTQFLSSYRENYYYHAAQLGLAYSLEQEGDPAAVSAFEKVANTSKNPQMQVDAYLGMARGEETRGNKDRAKEIYEKIITDFPDNLYGIEQATGRLDALK